MFPTACYPKQMATSRVPAFLGPMDQFPSAVEMWATKRLLTSWEGPLFTVEVDADGGMSFDVFPLANGDADVDTLLANVGVNDWYIAKFWGQRGFANVSMTGGGRPRGAVDGFNNVYAFPVAAGFTTSSLTVSIAGIPVTAVTLFSVSGSTGFGTNPVNAAEVGVNDVRMLNFGSQITTQLSGAGTEATLNGTNADAYSIVLQVNASGNRITNGTPATGTNALVPLTVNHLGLGYGSGGAFWCQGSPIYAGGFFADDVGDATADAIQAALKEYFSTQ